jgi:hypothetical protein
MFSAHRFTHGVIVHVYMNFNDKSTVILHRCDDSHAIQLRTQKHMEFTNRITRGPHPANSLAASRR